MFEISESGDLLYAISSELGAQVSCRVDKSQICNIGCPRFGAMWESYQSGDTENFFVRAACGADVMGEIVGIKE